MKRPTLRNPDGFVLPMVIAAVAVMSLALFLHLSVLYHETTAVYRSVGRAQALYLAEAGLDAAIDLLAQDWMAHRIPSRFPMQEDVSATVDRSATSIGAYEVAVEVVNADTMQLTSTGRSLPQAAGFACARTLTAVIVRKRRPEFHRGAGPGLLELAVDYFDKDGLPDVVALSGELLGHADAKQPEGTLSGGQGDGPAAGYHLMAGFTDVDLDGDLDLVLSDAPSRTERRHEPFIQTIELSPEQRALRPGGMTAADVLGTGAPIVVLSQGWLWAPHDALTGTEEDADIFITEPRYDGLLVASWSEIR